MDSGPRPYESRATTTELYRRFYKFQNLFKFDYSIQIMAIEQVVNASSDLIIEIGRLGNWIQAIGIIVIFWAVLQIITLIINIKKKRILTEIKKDLRRIENKIDKK